MQDDIFEVTVPDSELEAPAFEPMPAGAYVTTLQPGASLASNQTGWKGIRLPFSGFRSTNGKGEFTRSLRAQFTYEHATSPRAVEIGRQGIVGAAAAVGLTEPSQTADGKAGQRLTAKSYEELVEQFNAMAGTEVEVYIVAKARMRNGQAVQRNDGTGVVMDNEIRNVRAVSAPKEAA